MLLIAANDLIRSSFQFRNRILHGKSQSRRLHHSHIVGAVTHTDSGLSGYSQNIRQQPKGISPKDLPEVGTKWTPIFCIFSIAAQFSGLTSALLLKSVPSKSEATIFYCILTPSFRATDCRRHGKFRTILPGSAAHPQPSGNPQDGSDWSCR